MHKITKGLKKKKKGKKSKHKEDELFKPEELEAYRREHQHQQQEVGENSEKPGDGENEEWKKFKALTSGVDDILKKTQGDLDRIKSTSFFQRVPPPSEVKKQEEEKKAEEKAAEEAHQEEKQILAETEAAIVEVSESESEEDDEDDIFDTTYIDAIAAGEVKLAYIPESPTEQPDGDDPFDTSYAEKAILGPNTERKGKKLVPIGSAVEILTGRVQAPTCVPVKRPSTRRQVFKERDLLLGSFDDNANSVSEDVKDETPVNVKQLNLLDDDAPPELANEPIDLSKSFIQACAAQAESDSVQNQGNKENVDPTRDILEEFDVIAKSESPLEDDDDDKEFALLAAESLSKTPAKVVTSLPPEVVPQPVKESWNAFGDEKANDLEGDVFEDDPFDTTFAENILPGQAELKILEKEILDTDNDFDFNPRADEKYSELIRSTVSIQLTNPSGQRESLSSLDRVSEEDLCVIKPIHRDLLGGSSTDLSQLGDQPLQPKETFEEEEHIEYSDPFDTSIVDAAALPGTTELKFLERELLGDIKTNSAPTLTRSLSDEDFDPRAGDSPQHTANAQSRKVSFDLPLDKKTDLLGLGGDDAKVAKPLTPYYVRGNSIPECRTDEEQNVDPFDTSFVSDIGPGKAELKLIEDELFKQVDDICDQDFDPRDDKQVAIAKVVQTIKGFTDPTLNEKAEAFEDTPQIDLLGVDNDIATKVLTPSAEAVDTFEEIGGDIDPFDTSIASNILPGKTELKLLESELIHSEVGIRRNLTDPDFDPRDNQYEKESTNLDLLGNQGAGVGAKPLTPLVGRVSFEIGNTEDDDFDPFDTSIANNIAPGPSELKLLESELI